MKNKEALINSLAKKAIKMSGSCSSEIERCCWVVLHEYHHGAKPLEYDVRDIDEALYLSILKYAKKQI